MDGLISIPEFMAHLKAEGLVIVNVNDIAMASDYQRRETQRKWLKKQVIPFTEVIRAGFFPLTSVEGLHHWRRDNKFKENEVYQDSKKRWMMMVSAIKRLGYAE